jgi:hexulose-6-phosphate isomerase
MHIGLSQLTMPNRDLPPQDLFRQAKDWGYDGIELLLTEEGPVSLAASDADLAQVKRLAADMGLPIVSLCPRMSADWALTSPDAAVRDRGRQVVRGLIRAAAALDTGAFLLVPGHVSPQVRYDHALDRARDALAELAPEAAAAGVTIAVENVWNRLLLSPVEARDFVDEIGEGVGWYFDIGNVVIFGYPEQWIEILGERIARVHAKDFRRQGYQFVPLLEGDVDWPRVMAALRAVGFDHYLTSEVDGDEAAQRRTAESLRQILAL